MTEPNPLTYVAAFVGELARSGLNQVCFCPGSRSTPLAVYLARHPDMRMWAHIDERSAGFFALGMAKALGRPVALLCTSGTAAANFLPAIVEAFYARVPLIVLTADRPHEARDIGSPQTIDQLKMYGAHVKWFVEMALPEATKEMIHYARSVACRAVSTARQPPAGPVHLNFPLREPLMPELPSDDHGLKRDSVDSRSEPSVTVTPAIPIAPAERIECLARDLWDIDCGLIVCGPQDDPQLAEAVVRLAEALDYPVLADPLSQVRCGRHHSDHLIDAYDAFLRARAFCREHEPGVILRIGAVPTSKPLTLYIRDSACRQILIDPYGWRDPMRSATHIIHADPRRLCEDLVSEVSKKATPKRGYTESSWSETWRTANRRTREVIAQALQREAGFFEGKVFARLAQILPDQTTLYVGSSMPVRDLDTFFPASKRRLRFLANRGANGIDGVVSSALGAAAVADGPLVLAIGDLSFYHDLNGLLAVRLHALDATIVLLHNDGGGIFSFLPQAEHPTHFQTLFGTPHGIDFHPAVEMYGGIFARAESWEHFDELIKTGLHGDGLTVVEVKSDRDANVQLHRNVWASVSQAISSGGMESTR